MRQAFIVKPVLSVLGKVDLLSMQKLEALLFAGEVRESSDLPSSLSALTSDEKSWVLEKATQIRGNPALLLQRLESLPVAPPEDERAHTIWQERLFLKGFALYRLNRPAEAIAYFDQLPRRFLSRIQIERALYRVNRGDFPGAAALFQAVLECDLETEFDTYSLCTLLGGYCLALLYKGDFKAAKRRLEERKKILQHVYSPVLAFGTGLYEILLALEENNFDRAASLLNQALMDQDRQSVNWYFLLHLQLRLNLARGLLAQAGSVLQELKLLSQSLNLPEGVLDFRLEEIEWKLRSQVLPEALQEIEDVERTARVQGDEFLLFRLMVIKAQVLSRQGRHSEALNEIQQAVHSGESKGYRPALTWALFHAAGIAWTSQQVVLAKLFLRRGRRLTEELGLRGRAACFAYMSDVVENRHASASVLIALAKYQEIGPELEYFLDTYHLLDSAGFAVSDGQKHTLVQESNLRRMFFREPAIFCFQKEALVIANLGLGQVRATEFESGSPLLAVFRLFLEAHLQKNKLTLASIHECRSPHRYREDLHAPSTKMLLSRLRAKFAECGLKIAFDRQAGTYTLKSELSLYAVKSRAPEVVEAPAKTREEELLKRIAMEASVSTHDLCAEFRVTRQALHPILKRLVARGKVRVVRRGPISSYVFLGKR